MVETSGATARPALLRPRRVWLMLLVALVAGAVMAAPYITLDITRSRLSVSSELHYGLLVVHIGTALVALVLGPLQFVPAIQVRRRVHRQIGRTYLLVGVLPSAITVIPVALLSGRLITQVGLVIPAVGWLVTGALAVRAIRRGDPRAHQDWMLRNYALTFLAITARILVPLMLLGELPFGITPANVAGLIPIGQVLGWVVNLAIVELLIRRHRARSGRVVLNSRSHTGTSRTSRESQSV
jgi:uncharacterized membrane protein YozB (DUF420 family)